MAGQEMSEQNKRPPDLQCPFCGSFAIKEDASGEVLYLTCKNCNATGPQSPIMAIARHAWNRRSKGPKRDQIRSYYGCGALVTNEPVPGITGSVMDFRCVRFYGGRYMIAENMSMSAARAISEALGLNFYGDAKKWKEDIPAKEIGWVVPLLENKY